ncbi:MAG TPA: nucleotidyltransferase family protein [Gaiellaceae bacterium]|nr:nucleotidyltransferase family protein [Gaiellaceae bacterium]
MSGLKAVILAAGYATRLRPLTDDVPKMLLPLAGRPMLDYLLAKIREVDEVDELHLVTNARFADAFSDWAPDDVTVHDDGTTSNEDRRGAIGDIAFTVEEAGLEGENLLVVAGDNLIGYSVQDYVRFWRGKDGSAIALYECCDPELIKQYGVVELDDDDRVLSFEEKPDEPRSELAATAAYLYRAEDVALLDRYLAEGESPDAPGNYVQWLHTRAPVYGYRFSGEWLDIGDHSQLLEADNRMRKRAGLPPRAEYALD